MCLAVPGKVVSIINGVATIDYGSEQREASTSLLTPEIGDYVIVSAKFVMRVIPEEDAIAALKIWDETDGD